MGKGQWVSHRSGTHRVSRVYGSFSDFGLIFEELLPGNFAKLQPPEGQDLTEGLEVKVRLGSIWKASLTELSGGQRSVTSRNPLS